MPISSQVERIYRAILLLDLFVEAMQLGFHVGVWGATVPSDFMYFTHGVTLFVQRIILEQIFVDLTHVVKNEVQKMI